VGLQYYTTAEKHIVLCNYFQLKIPGLPIDTRAALQDADPQDQVAPAKALRQVNDSKGFGGEKPKD